MVSVKAVMVVVFITGIKMKADPKYFTAVRSKSHDVVWEFARTASGIWQTSVYWVLSKAFHQRWT